MPALSSDPAAGGTFVSVGNRTEPFHHLLEAVRRGAEAGCLPLPLVVQHGHTPFELDGATVVQFMDMDAFLLHVRMARLLVIHGGAGSIISALRAGKVPVVMARTHARGEVLDDHQTEFVRGLGAQGRIVVLDASGDLCRVAAAALGQQAGRLVDGQPESPLLQRVREDLEQIARARCCT